MFSTELHLCLILCGGCFWCCESVNYRLFARMRSPYRKCQRSAGELYEPPSPSSSFILLASHLILHRSCSCCYGAATDDRHVNFFFVFNLRGLPSPSILGLLMLKTDRRFRNQLKTRRRHLKHYIIKNDVLGGTLGTHNSLCVYPHITKRGVDETFKSKHIRVFSSNYPLSKKVSRHLGH